MYLINRLRCLIYGHRTSRESYDYEWDYCMVCGMVNPPCGKFFDLSLKDSYMWLWRFLVVWIDSLEISFYDEYFERELWQIRIGGGK